MLRTPLALALLAFVGCSSAHSTTGTSSPPPDNTQPPPDNTLAPPASGYQITTPDFTINPGEEKYMCFYTTLPNADALGVKSYKSKMTPGSHHMIVFTTTTPVQPDGMLVECGGGVPMDKNGLPAVWGYGAQQPDQELAMPDGVGVTMPAHTPVIVNMHYLNVTQSALVVHVAVNIETWAAGTTYTQASAYITFDTNIDVPAHGTQTVNGSCAVDPSLKFFALSTHSHKHTTLDTVGDGASTLVTTTDWEHPAFAYSPKAPFMQFSTGKLGYSCTYKNDSDANVTVGESANTNEMCMAIGYAFPKTGPTWCFDGKVYNL